jgi:hypothetical protein
VLSFTGALFYWKYELGEIELPWKYELGEIELPWKGVLRYLRSIFFINKFAKRLALFYC